jgi:hypothetical protein
LLQKKGSVNITPVIEAAQDLQNVGTDTEVLTYVSKVVRIGILL